MEYYLTNTVEEYEKSQIAKETSDELTSKFQSTINQGLAFITNFLNTKKTQPLSKAETQADLNRNLFDELSTFIPVLSSIFKESKKIKIIICYVCKKFKLKQSMIESLQMEISMIENQNILKLTMKENLNMKNSKFENLLGNGGMSKINFIIMSSLSFINDRLVFLKLLQINKLLYNFLSPKILKHLLSLFNYSFTEKHITLLWIKMLKIDLIKDCYKGLKENLILNSKRIELSTEAIHLDLKNDDMNTQDAVSRILKCYSLYNPSIEYCQGMSYIVSFLFAVTKDESQTFNIFSSIVDKMKLIDLFKIDSKLLKLLIFQFIKIIPLLIPDLSEKFKEEKIYCQYFSHPWFLTLFSYLYHLQKQKEISKFLISTWNLLILVI